jgi:CubicO group peptidase (beta-lactamase class C family)
VSTPRFDEARLDAIFAPHASSQRPGVVVGVAHRGVRRYRRGFGVASVELPLALTSATRLRVASVTKQFCAFAVMRLAEQGTLSVDDSIRRHLPDLPTWAEPITARQLMSHTGGLHCSIDLLFHLHGAAGRAVGAGVQGRLIRLLRSVNFAPGTDFSYCNAGYTLLTELVERCAQQPFGEFLQQQVLTPIGMHDSGLRVTDTELWPGCATQHVRRADGGFERELFGPPHDGAGGLVSTVDDMLRWLAHLRAPHVGSEATWGAMTTPAALAHGASTGYALGLMIGQRRGQRAWHHGGNVMGGAADMLRLPDHDLDIVVIANQGGVDVAGLADAVIDACIEGAEPAAAPARLALRGDFLDAERGRVLRMLADDEGRSQIEVNGLRLPLMQRADGTLRCRSNPARGATVEPAADGQALGWEEFGRRSMLPRVSPVQTTDAAALEGTYTVDGLDVQACIDSADGASHLRLRSAHGAIDYRLEAVAADAWLARGDRPLLPSGALLQRAGSGTLRLSTQRTRALALRREERAR